MTYQQELQLKEYEKLNLEVEFIMAECSQREKYSVAVTAGIAAWLFSKETISPGDQWNIAIACIPLVTTLLFAFNIWMFTNRLLTIRVYIRKHIFEDGTCWDKFLDDSNEKKSSAAMAYAKAFWVIQIVICIGLIMMTIPKCG